MMNIRPTTVNSEKIALVYFLRFKRLASDAKLKFAMFSAAILSALYVAVNLQSKKRKNQFSVNSQTLLYTIFCESTLLILAEVRRLTSANSNNPNSLHC